MIYRFSSSLFFANIDILQQDIENAIGSDTKAVILDASGIGSIYPVTIFLCEAILTK